MSESFNITISKPLKPSEFTAAFIDLIPAGLRVDVKLEMADLPEEPGAVWALVETTDDPSWPCVLNVGVFSDECGLAPYPDLCVAARLWERFEADSLCATYPFVGDLDPYDPYWTLACVGGLWYLASTAGTRLMGQYSDGTRKFEGEDLVRLVHPVVVPDTIARIRISETV